MSDPLMNGWTRGVIMFFAGMGMASLAAAVWEWAT